MSRCIRGVKDSQHAEGACVVPATLYMATLSAMRFNPVIKVFADRLRTAGKPFKAVAIACIRTLLTILNVMFRDNHPWRNPCTAKHA